MCLLAVANAGYEFICCDIGTEGSMSDGKVIEKKILKKKKSSWSFAIVVRKKWQNRAMNIPYVRAGDEDFTFHQDL